MELEVWRVKFRDNIYIGRNEEGRIFIQLGERVLEFEEGDIKTAGTIKTNKDGVIFRIDEDNIQIISNSDADLNQKGIIRLVQTVYRIEKNVNNFERELNNSPAQCSQKGEISDAQEIHNEEENSELVGDIRIVSLKELTEILGIDRINFRSTVEEGKATIIYEDKNGNVVTRRFKKDEDRIVEVNENAEEIATFKKGENGKLQEIKPKENGTNSDVTGDGR